MHPWLSANRSNLGAILRFLDTPVSLSQWLLLKNGEWDQLATRWLDPRHYPEGIFSALRYRRDVQAIDLLRKAPLPTTIDRRSEALKAWEHAETQCYITNELMLRLFSTRVSPSEEALARFLVKVRNRIARWLGPVPDSLDGGFGPGTCVEYKEASPTVVDKIWLTPTTTPAAAPYFSVLHGRTLWGLERAQAGLPFLGTSRGNRLTTVPKDGKTDRPICIEPLGNLWLQLGVGRYLKKRLHLSGLPPFGDTTRVIFPGCEYAVPDAQAIHRRLAREGLDRELCTIDLSSASDTISTGLVRHILPADWFELLNDLRSPLTFVPSEDGGRWRLLEKFSSMGNGFTFELETLIFLGLLSVAFDLTPGVSIWVFGDDIIIPAEKGERACNLLTSVGFTPNLRKTYLSGPFRESCGGHFHSRLDVNPVRLTSANPTETIPQVFSLHNALLAWGFPYARLGWLREKVPVKYRVSGPRRLGDVVLHGPRHGRCIERDGIMWAKVLKFLPENQIPLDRWSPELALTAICLGVPPRLVRRGTRVKPSLGLASVS